jgi:hypothetical protein
MYIIKDEKNWLQPIAFLSRGSALEAAAPACKWRSLIAPSSGMYTIEYLQDIQTQTNIPALHRVPHRAWGP